MLIDILIKFREYSLKGFSSYRTDMVFVMHKFPREITHKVLKTELPFLHSARHLMLIDICIKFHEYSLRGFQIIERTRFL